MIDLVGDKDKTEKTACPTCGKNHKGKCWKGRDLPKELEEQKKKLEELQGEIEKKEQIAARYKKRKTSEQAHESNKDTIECSCLQPLHGGL